MPHVDDGTLHALLDGALRAEDPARADRVEAHLESCPDCRALRDHATALRAQATGILAALEPDARPDFQEVLARAGHATAPADGAAGLAVGATAAAGDALGVRDARGAWIRQARATRAVAWAATIVLALGTGYLIRDLVGPEAMTTSSRTAASPEWSAAERSAAEGSAPERSAPESVAGDRDHADRASDRHAGDGRATGAGAYAAESVEPAPPTATPPAGVATPPVPVARVQAPDASTQVAGAPVPADEAPRRVPDTPLALESAVDAVTFAPMALTGEPVPVVAAPRPAMQEAARVTARRAADDADRPPIRLRGVSPTTGAGFMAVEELPDGEGWSAITLADARALMDGPVYVLPGAAVAGIFARGEGAAAEVRSVQRLDGAVALVVTQRIERRPEEAVMAEAVAPPVAPPVPPAPERPAQDAATDMAAGAPQRNEATARHDRHWITVAGQLPAETLQALAASAGPLPEGEAAHPPR